MIIPDRPGPRTDHGVFGPGSLAWEVIGHPIVIIGVFRNALYTALCTEVAQSVNDHSSWYVDPFSRAQQTMYYAVDSAFGSTDEARRAGKWVQGRHAGVTGIDPVTGNTYSPSRPDLALLGHGLIWESALASYETYIRRLTPAQRETYWQEGLTQASMLGIDISTLPPTWDHWRAYYDRVVFPRLSYSTTGHRLMAFTRSAGFAPTWTRPIVRAAVWLMEELTLATMPTTERALLGRPRSTAHVALTRWWGRRLAALINLAPIRDAIERSHGGHAHQVLAEARAIKAAHDHRPQAEPLATTATPDEIHGHHSGEPGQ